jgi:hypothetical protein
MTTFVTLSMSSSPAVEVNMVNFEALTGFRQPWAQTEPKTGHRKFYGRCPECGNAVQLINLEAQTPQVRPHGRHRLTLVPGFAYRLEDIKDCSLFDGRTSSEFKQLTAELSPDGEALLRAVPRYFDLMMTVFRKATGLILTVQQSREMLAAFLRSNRACWHTITPQNIAWLFAYSGTSFAFRSLVVDPRSPLFRAIREKVDGVELTKRGAFVAKRGRRFALTFRLVRHVIEAGRETVDFSVTDDEDYNGDAESARPVFKATLAIRPAEYSARVAGRDAASVNSELSDYARRLNETAESCISEFFDRRRPAKT